MIKIVLCIQETGTVPMLVVACEQPGENDVNLRKSLFSGLLKLFVSRYFICILCFVEDGQPWALNHLLPKSPPCLFWAMVLPVCTGLYCHCQTWYWSFNISSSGFLLYRVDLSTVVLTEENHSHVVSSRLMARMIISVPQRFKVDFFCLCSSSLGCTEGGAYPSCTGHC